MKPTTLVLTCEHAVATVPSQYKKLFAHHADLLLTHRAVDFGALEITQGLSQALDCTAIIATATRLLIDCNRSLHHPQCFSKVTKSLTAELKQKIIDDYYQPFRTQAMQIMQQRIDAGFQVLHLSIHSFTPVMHGITRNAGIGLLYDPNRHGEKEVARLWHNILTQEIPLYRVRMNYPYYGTSDGFTTALRKYFPENCYLGLEVESNQILVREKSSLEPLIEELSNSLKLLMQML